MCLQPEECCMSGQQGAYFVLLGSILTIVRSENPFVRASSAPLPQGWVHQSSAGNAMATFWGLLWLALASAHLTSYESTRKSSRRWHQPKSSHFCWPVLLHLMHRWGTCHFCSILISCTLQFNCNNCWNVWEFLIGTALVRNTQPCDFL